MPDLTMVVFARDHESMTPTDFGCGYIYAPGRQADTVMIAVGESKGMNRFHVKRPDDNPPIKLYPASAVVYREDVDEDRFNSGEKFAGLATTRMGRISLIFAEAAVAAAQKVEEQIRTIYTTALKEGVEGPMKGIEPLPEEDE